ncbi:MAG: branched-chain amino acid ABC transporter permease [Burkholderiales bacterium]
MKRYLPYLLFIAALAITPFLDRFVQSLVYNFAIAAMAALAVNIMIGFAGQITFAAGALIGVGAYAGGLLGNAGLDVVSLLGAGLVTAAISVFIGLPALRLRGLYFAMSTLAAQFILEYLFKNVDPVTNGLSGLLIEPPKFFGIAIDTEFRTAIAALILLLLVWLACRNLTQSQLGRAFLVMRESEIVAKGMGINVPQTKFWCFALTGFLMGIAGAMLGFSTHIANPEAFGISLSVDYVAMMIIGGLGSLTGSLIGAAFITLMPEIIQRIGEHLHLGSRIFAVREIIFGALIMLFLIFEPRGIVALFSSLKGNNQTPGASTAK